MSGKITLRDYIRDVDGNGVNAAGYVVKRLVDNVTIASGTTASDADPTPTLAGMLSADETTMSYPGPYKYVVTDPFTGATRTHTSKSLGQVGAWRAADVPRFWRAAGTGVFPGVNGEFAVTTDGGTMNIGVASGQFMCVLGDQALLYSAPIGQTVVADAADGTNPRIDTVVIRFYPPGVEEEGRIQLALLKGTAAAVPAAPAPTQNLATIWEEPLGDVRVDATVTFLAVNKVTDRRTWCFVYPPSRASGDLFYVDATGKLARLAKGTDGQFTKLASGLPTWATIAESDVTNLVTDLSLKQPLDLTLTGLAALDATLGYVIETAADTFVKRTITAADTTITVANPAGTAGGTTIAVGTISAAQIGSGVVNNAEFGALDGVTSSIQTQLDGKYAPGGTDVAVADGGTGSSTASGARTNLGLVIGTNVQAWDADLDALAAKVIPAGALVGTTDAQTLTNKTLTTPAITAPTGIVKADVGLGNVDNTSDATKNAASATLTNKTLTAPVVATIVNTGTLTLPTSTDTIVGRATTDTLTNKTLTSPAITTPTGIVKGDVGLGNVDNTSDATKNAASVTLSNKTLTTPTIASFTNAGHIHQDAAGGSQWLVIDQMSQDASDSPSIVAVATFQVCITDAITMPAGTWSFRVAFDLTAAQGAAANISLKINVGGTPSGSTWSGGTLSAARSCATQSAAPGARVGMSTVIAGIAGGGTVNVFGGAITPSGGTLTNSLPRLLIDAWRTA